MMLWGSNETLIEILIKFLLNDFNKNVRQKFLMTIFLMIHQDYWIVLKKVPFKKLAGSLVKITQLSGKFSSPVCRFPPSIMGFGALNGTERRIRFCLY